MKGKPKHQDVGRMIVSLENSSPANKLRYVTENAEYAFETLRPKEGKEFSITLSDPWYRGDRIPEAVSYHQLSKEELEERIKKAFKETAKNQNRNTVVIYPFPHEAFHKAMEELGKSLRDGDDD
jgi:hypothetical protein